MRARVVLPVIACESEVCFDVAESVEVALQVAAVGATTESLTVTLDGAPVGADVVETDHGTRNHLVRVGAGALSIRYSAEAEPLVSDEVTPADAVRYSRQTRYCPSDVLEPFARRELAGLDGWGVGNWVFERLSYELGFSGPQDGAVDTLLRGEGVCRDYAHLTIALARALGMPARLVAVYAPSLWPMDFHAVAEVASADGRWELVDATRLAPPETMVRIATGRDAADTAFASTLSGSASLTSSRVSASVRS